MSKLFNVICKIFDSTERFLYSPNGLVFCLIWFIYSIYLHTYFGIIIWGFNIYNWFCCSDSNLNKYFIRLKNKVLKKNVTPKD